MNIVEFTQGKSLIRFELHSLDDEMDLVIRNLLIGFFTSENASFPTININLLVPFENELLEYFDRRYKEKSSDFGMHQDYLFNNLGIISNQYLSVRLFKDAEEFWEKILSIVTKWENSRGIRIHKGSIYYFWARVALLNNEIEKGFLLIHKAYLEDCITHETLMPDTPAYLTVSMNYSNDKNMLQGYVKLLWNYVVARLEEYNTQNHKNLSQETVYEGFIQKPPSMDVLALFSQTIAKIQQFDHMGGNITNSGFAGLCEINVLFDLLLVIENYLLFKVPESTEKSNLLLGGLIKQLLLDSDLEKDVKTINENLTLANKKHNEDFDETINQLLSRSFKFDVSKPVDPIYFDIFLCYCLRNHGAHSIEFTKEVSNNFSIIKQKVFNFLFFGIETYK